MTALTMQGAKDVEVSVQPGEDAAHFLPQMPASSRTPSAHRHHGDLPSKPRAPPDHHHHQQQQYRHAGRPPHMQIPANTEVLQAMMRERDMELLRLRHENALLKQIERRQQKDIEQLEWHSEERVIHALRDEVTGLKQKLKLYFTQLSSNTRELRHVSEDRQRLKEQNSRLEKLASDRHLAEREHLHGEVDALTRRIAVLEKIAGDAVKRAELTEKNMTIDNRHLRSRIHVLEKDVTEAREKAQKLEEHIRDREKEICSLEIYRYNAVHRKADATCKNCHHKDADASERKRKSDILARLPALAPPQVGTGTPSTLEILYTLPRNNPGAPDHAVEFSSLTLLYSTDATMHSGVHKVELPIMDDEVQHDETSKPLDDNLSTQGKPRKKARADMSQPGKGAPSGNHTKTTVDGLEGGTTYYFQLVCGHLDIDGTPTTAIKARTAASHPHQREHVEAKATSIPVPPRPPKLSVERLAETTVRVFAEAMATHEQVHAYRLITVGVPTTDTGSAQTPGFAKQGADTELELPPSCVDEAEFSHVLEGLQAGQSFCFRYLACNEGGWSEPSEQSDPIHLDTVAPQTEPEPVAHNEPAIMEPDPDFDKAVGIPLPPSPLPPAEEPAIEPATIIPAPAPPAPDPAPSANEVASDAPEPGKLLKANSKTGSNLTLDQRVENMHHGLPAHFEPPLTVGS